MVAGFPLYDVDELDIAWQSRYSISGPVNLKLKNISKHIHSVGIISIAIEEIPAGTETLSNPKVVEEKTIPFPDGDLTIAIKWEHPLDSYVIDIRR